MLVCHCDQTYLIKSTHQHIQLGPLAGKESSVYAECGEDGDIVWFEDNFLCQKENKP